MTGQTGLAVELRGQPIRLVGSDYSPEGQLRRGLRRGMLIICVLVLGLGTMAATLPMTGAVIAPGSVSVATFVKQIAHPFGGVVAEVRVRDGDRVSAGQVLLRFDDRVSQANADLTGESLDQLLARSARLIAERDALGRIVFPAILLSRSGDPNIAALMRGEEVAFQLRRAARQGQSRQIEQKIAETNAEIAGLRAQGSSYSQQAELIGQELAVQRGLFEKKYTTLDRLNALERAAVSISASADSARSGAAGAQARIAELRAQAVSLGQEARSAAAGELMEVQARIADLRRQKVAADDAYHRSTIRAPYSGVVDKLVYRTIGAVVPPGDTIMEIVPDRDRLVVEVRLPVTQIDQVREGQAAILRFSAFSAQTTPELRGAVNHVSADRTVEKETGMAYYRATITLSDAELRRLGGLKLRPGMPVEAFVQTEERTMLSYIIRPLRDQLNRAFRES
jgi:HlyD family secretion protein